MNMKKQGTFVSLVDFLKLSFFFKYKKISQRVFVLNFLISKYQFVALYYILFYNLN